MVSDSREPLDEDLIRKMLGAIEVFLRDKKNPPEISWKVTRDQACGLLDYEVTIKSGARAPGEFDAL